MFFEGLLGLGSGVGFREERELGCLFVREELVGKLETLNRPKP